ncbi:MAG: hypothetical protein GF364_09610 [Candidatus Lokiarchaeota archaeon]|nr:hypothetical protein [Candidatus Lokiarchaeota archaeon]
MAKKQNKIYDFTLFETEFFPEWIKQFRSGSKKGEYCYKKTDVDLEKKSQSSTTSLYGTTDMLISLYDINQLHLTESEKDEWAKMINQFQNPNTGWFEKTYTMHYKEHTTAYAVAALYLIDRRPQYPLKWKHDIISSKNSMKKWINGINWSIIWPSSHIVSGVPAALAMADEGTDEFFNWYFDWLDKHADPKSGFYLRGFIHRIKIVRKPTKQELGGAFHMYYVYEFFNRKWPYPEKIVDECIRLQKDNGLWDKDVTYCIDLDGLYSMIRSSRNANWYRKSDVRESVEKYLETAERIFNDKEFFFQSYQNSHKLTGALNAIAECQKWFPDLVRTTKPWQQSLDKACFI